VVVVIVVVTVAPTAVVIAVPGAVAIVLHFCSYISGRYNYKALSIQGLVISQFSVSSYCKC
jgi:hypothetical protein